MAAISDTVKPGDIITSDLLNRMISLLNEHDALLSSSPSTGLAPIIDQVLPSVLRVGETLTLVGRNFDSPPDKNIVTIGGFIIDRFEISPDGELIFGVPLIDIAGSKLDTQVTVRTGNGVSSRPVTLLPQLVIPVGFVVFTQDSANQAQPALNANAQVDIGFFVDSQTNIAESYVITASYSDAAGAVTADQWLANTTLKTGTGDPITATPIKINAFQPFKVVVHVTVPSAAVANTTTVKLTLRAQSVNNDSALSRSADPLLLTAGQGLPFNDSRVEWVNEVPSAPTSTNNARRVTDTATGKEFVEVPFGGNGLLNLRANFKINGNFAYSVAVDPANGGAWNTIKASPASSTGKSNGENELVGIVLKPLTAANSSHTEARTLTIVATRTPPPGAPGSDTLTFTSWTTVNIRGYTP